MGGGPDAKPRPEHILFTLPFPEPKELVSQLHKDHPHTHVRWLQTARGSDAPDPEVFKNVTVIVTFGGKPGLPAKLDDAPHLHWVHLLSAGIDGVTSHPVYTDSDMTITSSNGVGAPNIAEWVIMTMLTNAHLYDRFHDQQKEHVWDKDSASIDDMVMQRIGILGYGAIGRHVGRIAKAMGMDVLAYTASPKETKESRRETGYIVPGTGDPEGEIPSAWYSGLDKKNLHEFLSQDLDVIVLTLPLTNDTRHMIGPDEFSILSKKNTFVSNISRGPIIQTEALIAALKDKKIRGAAVDVTDPEPLPKDSELWDQPNLVVTPHVSGNTGAYMERAFALFGESLRRVEKGEQPFNVVQRKRGY